MTHCSNIKCFIQSIWGHSVNAKCSTHVKCLSLKVSFVSASGRRKDYGPVFHFLYYKTFIRNGSEWLHVVCYVLEQLFYCMSCRLSVCSSLTVVYSKREMIPSWMKAETLNKPSLAAAFSPHSNHEHDSNPPLDVLTLYPTTSHQHDHFIVTSTQAWAVMSDPVLSLSWWVERSLSCCCSCSLLSWIEKNCPTWLNCKCKSIKL